jgi:hypothetical protein
MKNLGYGHYTYNGCDVYLFKHPLLSGKYEIYFKETYIGRVSTLKLAKQLILAKA